MKLIINAGKCSGCRVCEVICSFHHRKVFSRKISSIVVSREERKGEFEPLILAKAEGKRLPCDLCNGEKSPLCVRFCTTKALTVEE
jgi:Fe-S-cluster-containing hydrogenase component 2